MPNFNLTDQSGLRTIVGHVGREPELRHTQSGKRVARFTLATNRKDGAGNVTTDWHTINAWEDQADAVMAGVRKGYVVGVVGKESTREYNGKQYTELTAWFVGVAPSNLKSSNAKKQSQGEPKSILDAEVPF